MRWLAIIFVALATITCGEPRCREACREQVEIWQRSDGATLSPVVCESPEVEAAATCSECEQIVGEVGQPLGLTVDSMCDAVTEAS